jgi:hypothetical protein
MPRAHVHISAALLLLAPLGCSVSTSSRSPSDSVASIVGSMASSSASSSSSSPGAAERAYRADVTDYTKAYVGSGGDVRNFSAGLGRLAERRGITDWEQSEATYLAVGEGLGRARVGEGPLLVWQQALAGSDPRKTQAIRQGYDSVR